MIPVYKKNKKKQKKNNKQQQQLSSELNLWDYYMNICFRDVNAKDQYTCFLAGTEMVMGD